MYGDFGGLPLEVSPEIGDEDSDTFSSDLPADETLVKLCSFTLAHLADRAADELRNAGISVFVDSTIGSIGGIAWLYVQTSYVQAATDVLVDAKLIEPTDF